MAKTLLPNDLESKLLAAREEMAYRLAAGTLHDASDLCDTYPELWDHPDAVVELIYAEYVLRADKGENPHQEKWLESFPLYSERLERLFAIYDAIQVEEEPRTDDSQYQTCLSRQSLHIACKAPFGYELVEEIGRGGMGVVYKSCQLALHRFVALKMLRGGLLFSDDDAKRITREAEAVARLQHPNIVQIHEIGHADGAPFLCLEYVDGGSLEEALTRTVSGGISQVLPREAVQLVETLARAMHYAHEHGVVHRDLKPGNILLSASSESNAENVPLSTDRMSLCGLIPKITDFGLATVAEHPIDVGRTGIIMGTPCYMAPEQTTGRLADISPLTDVYSLGGVLYRLLTGRPPFECSTVLETIDQVLHAEPVPPRRLRPAIPVDLETICLKCLEKEPTKRYTSALALAEDCRHYLQGEPIVARPISVLERGIKWAKRRPVPAAFVAVFVMTILATIMGLVWHDVRVREEQRQTLDTLLASLQIMEEICEPIWDNDLPRDPQVDRDERLLLDKAFRLYETFSQKHASNLVLRQHTAKAYRAIGRIHFHLGKLTEAQAAYRRAVQITAELMAENVGAVVHGQELAFNNQRLGVALLLAGQLHEAEQSLQQAELLYHELTRAFPNEAKHRFQLAELQRILAELLTAKGQMDHAEKRYHQATNIAEQLARDFAQVAAYRLSQANSLQGLGMVLMQQRKFKEALQTHEHGLSLGRQLLQESPRNAHYRRAVSLRYNSLGNLFAQMNQPDKATKAFGDALELSRGLAQEFSTIPRHRLDVAQQLNNLAIVFLSTGNKEQARSHSQEALGLCRKLVMDHPDTPDYQLNLGGILCQLGLIARHDGELVESRRFLDEAISHELASLKASPKRRINLIVLRDAYAALAETLLCLQQPEQAAQMALKIPQLLPELDEYVRTANLLARCRSFAFTTDKLSGQQATALANSFTEQALGLLDKAILLKPKRTSLLMERAFQYSNLGKWDKAAADFAMIVDARPDNLDHLATYAFMLLLAGQMEKYREARQQLHQRVSVTDHRQGYLVARIDSLSDGSTNGDRCLRLVAEAVQAEPRLAWYQHGMGMAHYRAGKFAESILDFQTSMSEDPQWIAHVNNWLGLAMAHERLGQHEEARRWLAKATHWIDVESPRMSSAFTPSLPLHPHDWFACLLLRREAETLLKAPPSAVNR